MPRLAPPSSSSPSSRRRRRRSPRRRRGPQLLRGSRRPCAPSVKRMKKRRNEEEKRRGRGKKRVSSIYFLVSPHFSISIALSLFLSSFSSIPLDTPRMALLDALADAIDSLPFRYLVSSWEREQRREGREREDKRRKELVFFLSATDLKNFDLENLSKKLQKTKSSARRPLPRRRFLAHAPAAPLHEQLLDRLPGEKILKEALFFLY